MNLTGFPGDFWYTMKQVAIIDDSGSAKHAAVCDLTAANGSRCPDTEKEKILDKMI